MKEILSTKVKLHDDMSMNQILSLHQFTRNYKGTVYMIGRQKVINPNNLPKLVSFFLTSKNSDEVKIVVQGTNVHSIVTNLQNYFKPRYRVSKPVQKVLV